MLALQAASGARGVEAQLAAGVTAGKVSQTEATLLQDTYRLCWRLRSALRLVSDQGSAPEGQGATGFVLRETGLADMGALVAALAGAAAAADDVISARLGR